MARTSCTQFNPWGLFKCLKRCWCTFCLLHTGPCPLALGVKGRLLVSLSILWPVEASKVVSLPRCLYTAPRCNLGQVTTSVPTLPTLSSLNQAPRYLGRAKPLKPFCFVMYCFMLLFRSSPSWSYHRYAFSWLMISFSFQNRGVLNWL